MNFADLVNKIEIPFLTEEESRVSKEAYIALIGIDKSPSVMELAPREVQAGYHFIAGWITCDMLSTKDLIGRDEMLKDL